MSAIFFMILVLCLCFPPLKASPLVDFRGPIAVRHDGPQYRSFITEQDDESPAIAVSGELEPRSRHKQSPASSRALQVRDADSSPGGLYYDRGPVDETDKCLEILSGALSIVNTVVTSTLGPILFGLTGSSTVQSSITYIIAKTAFDLSAEYLAFAYCKLSSSKQEQNVPALPGSAPPVNNPATTVDLTPSGGFTAKQTYCIVGDENKCRSKLGPAAKCAQVAVKVTTNNFLQWLIQHNGLPFAAAMWDAFVDQLDELHGAITNVFDNPILGICKILID